jgi:hypothetical protein
VFFSSVSKKINPCVMGVMGIAVVVVVVMMIMVGVV